MGQDMIIIILANNSYYNDNDHKDCVIIALYFISLHDTKTVVEQSFFYSSMPVILTVESILL